MYCDDPFIIYSRKSKFTGKGDSVENQIEMCRQFIRIHYGEEAAENISVYEDEGFSGKNLERPKFKKMMADAKKRQFRAIVVYRLDRISRNIGDFAKLIEQLNRMKIGFISIKEQFDTSSPMGRAMMYISSVFSQLEWETIAERIRDNMHELSKTGRWLGGVTPTGFASESMSYVSVDGKTRKACKLKIIPEEMSVVNVVMEAFLQTHPLTKTETYLLQHGYKTRAGKDFTRFAIRNILTNPVYMIADEAAYEYLVQHQANLFSEKSDFDGVHGIMAYNRTLQQQGKATLMNPVEEWIVSVGKHEGILPGTDWVKIQQLLERNRSKSYRAPRTHVALLSGLLICGNCGEYMRPKLTNRSDGKGELIYTYMCSMKERSRRRICSIKACSGNILDADVIKRIKQFSETNSDFVQQIEQSKRVLMSSGERYDEKTALLERQIVENEAEINGLILSLAKASGTSAEEYIMKRIGELHDKGKGLKRHLAERKKQTAGRTLADMEFQLLAQRLASFKDQVDEMSVEEKRDALRMLVKEIVWDGETAHVILIGSDYKYEFPKVPVGIGENLPKTAKEEKMTGTEETWSAKPLGEDSK